MRKLNGRDHWARAEAFGDDFEGSPCMVLPNRPGADGYVSVKQDGRMVQAHRLIYETLIGPIPARLTLDHRCAAANDLRGCVNPWHLEPVTHRENIRRGRGQSARNARKKSCARGHPLSGDNLRFTKAGHRVCLTCKTRRVREWRSKNVEAYRKANRERERSRRARARAEIRATI